MGKRGRVPKSLRIEIGKNEQELRYTSLMDALTAALPDIAEAIIRENSSQVDVSISNAGTQKTDDDPRNDHEQNDLKL
jgi:hypothetical protein